MTLTTFVVWAVLVFSILAWTARAGDRYVMAARALGRQIPRPRTLFTMVYLYAGLFGRDRPAMVQIPDPDPQLERLREAAHHRVRMFPLLVLISLAAAFVAGSIAPVLG